jgi:hypothetical protein
MSAPSHGHDPSPQRASLDDDGIDMHKILAVGGVSLFVFAVSAVIALLIMRHDVSRMEAQGKPPAPSQIGKDEIGIVDQVEFSGDYRLEEWKAAKRKRLQTYGWVNKERGLIRIPIDRAMDEVVTQEAASSREAR